MLLFNTKLRSSKANKLIISIAVPEQTQTSANITCTELIAKYLNPFTTNLDIFSFAPGLTAVAIENTYYDDLLERNTGFMLLFFGILTV